MHMMTVGVGMWIYAFMLFKINPLNDPNDPRSLMCRYHLANLRGGARLKEILEKEKANGVERADPVVLWSDVWPYLCPTITTALTLLALWLTG